ncbi:membrane protein [Microbacterium phage TinyTimothy]|uniref:Uncharacterized protein n=1 Tax=Microbacterium phage TinyTimothy TaxID=2583039 RepID=A0A4Y6EES4_9CAUD|nr:membrane protein [Microbacterium phage TinyTimothy]QDF16972.1 hypothetical protein SEA_TINYTIMOTHY_19 [Microbacterium phage TinyTimothy]
MSTDLPLCGHGDTVTLYPTPDNCFEQFNGHVIVHYKGEDYTYPTPENASPVSALVQDCPDLYATCSSAGVVWKFEEPEALPATGVDGIALLTGLTLGVVMLVAGVIVSINHTRALRRKK